MSLPFTPHYLVLWQSYTIIIMIWFQIAFRLNKKSVMIDFVGSVILLLWKKKISFLKDILLIRGIYYIFTLYWAKKDDE